jgi:hypothetical protein
MKLPLPPMHPQVPELLASLKLRLIEVIKWNVFSCAPADETGSEPAYVLKLGSDPRKAESIAYETRIMSEVLPTIDQRLFERLVLPEYVNDGTFGGLRWLLTRYVHGHPLIYDWSELAIKPETLGGRIIPVSVARDAVDILRDLRLVDISVLPKFVRRFDFRQWLADFKVKSGELVALALMEQGTVDQALAIFAGKSVERYEGSMFTNGDFYPRNFVELDGGKIAVTDWVGGIDPWEFTAMHAWLLMWGNPKWQIEYAAQLKKHFPIDPDEMQFGLLIKSFDQVYRWRGEPEELIGFARTQMLSYFRQCLDKEYVRRIFG